MRSPEERSDAAGGLIAAMIDCFAAEAMGRMAHPAETVIAGLCCTHYGYVAERFVEALRRAGARAVEVVDPNLRMAEALFPPGRIPPEAPSEVSVRVISRAEISDAEVRSIAALVEPVSAPTAAALRGWERDPNLLPFGGSWKA